MQLSKTFRGGVLGLAPCHVDRKIKLQVRLHSNLDEPSLAHAIQVPMGPARVEVLHLCRCYTIYTHTYIYIYMCVCV